MQTSLVLTVIADDRPGLVVRLADVVAAHGGNWIESSMARLAGEFAGIVRIEAPGERVMELEAALTSLAEEGILTTLRQSTGVRETHGQTARISILCQDHPGIVHSLAGALASKGASITHLTSEAFAGSMSGERMFRAEMDVVLPVDLETATLAAALEDLAGDLMAEVDFTDLN